MQKYAIRKAIDPAGGVLSSVELVVRGVSQGSVLDPLLYVLYAAELNQIFVSTSIKDA